MAAIALIGLLVAALPGREIETVGVEDEAHWSPTPFCHCNRHPTKLLGVTYGPAHLIAELVADWRNAAACSGYPNSLFFPASDSAKSQVERAKEVCRTCEVAEDCLEYAFETNQRAGIWGGTTEEERKSLRRKWLAARRRTA